VAGCATTIPPTPPSNPQPSEQITKPTKQLTRDKYGENIIYHDFFKLPKNLDTRITVELPQDLATCLNTSPYNLTVDSKRVHNHQLFEKDILEAISESGYTVSELSKMNYHDAIFAIVNIVADRMNYGTLGKNFLKRYERSASIDDNFHQRIGDCVRYTEATIVLFNYIKKDNPNFKNIYLTLGRLGGNLIDVTYHAWVAILIPQKNGLILSHIDPTFYDNYGLDKNKLEAGDLHICRALNDAVLKASVYREIEDRDNLLYTYNLFEKSYRLATTDEVRSIILDNLAYTLYRMSFFTPPKDFYKQNRNRLHWIIGEYERIGSNPLHACALYYAYTISSRGGDNNEADLFKQKLIKRFPCSKYALRLQRP
jgi:hypothetical protein